MPRIQCMLGPQSDVYVGSTPYNFVLDEHGRAVATVEDRLHVQCLISIEHYRLLPDDMILGQSITPPPVIDDTEDDDDDANGTGTDAATDNGAAPGIVLPEDEGATGEENGGSGDNTGGTSDTDAPEGDQNGQQDEGQGKTPPPADESGEQSKAPEGEGVKEAPKPEAPKPEKKRAGRPKKADAATKPNAE